MNTHALVVTHLRDEIVNCSNICAADHEEYLVGLPEKDQNIIASVRKKNTKGVEPWYPLTRRYLAKICYHVSHSCFNGLHSVWLKYFIEVLITFLCD